MAYSCWRCRTLARTHTQSLFRLSLHEPSIRIRSLHTTAIIQSPAPKKPVPKAGGARKTQTLKLGGRNKPVVRSKQTPEGERRALKERITLSNPNAPQVVYTPLSPELCTSNKAVGQVFGIPTDLVERLRILVAFQKSQMWQYFYRPSTLLRDESFRIGSAMVEIDEQAQPMEEVLDLRPLDQIKKEEAEKAKTAPATAKYKTKSFVLEGGAGVGKSIVLLHAIVWALQRNWLVITIPDAHDLTLGHTDYGFNPRTGLWDQQTYLKALLLRTLEANTKVLGQHTLSKPFSLGSVQVQEGAPLSKLVEIGARSTELAPDIWEALLHELSLEGAPPTLLTLDNLDYIMRNSEYKDTEFKPIHAHDLALPNTFLSYLSGNNLSVNETPKKRFFHRGLVLSATTSELHHNPSFQYSLTRRPLPAYGPYDHRLPASIGRRPTIVRMTGLSQAHTGKLLEYYRKSGIWDDAWKASIPLETAYKGAKLTIPRATLGLNQQLKRQEELRKDTVSDKEVVLKHVLTGGLPRELLKTCLRLT